MNYNIMVRPKKHLGQHFLTDDGIARRITDSFKGESVKTLVEVGPGKGVLTQFLKERKNFDFYAVEIDDESVAYLNEHFPELNDKIINGDFLRLDLSSYGSGIGVIGNFPYNISSQIFFKVLEYYDDVNEVVGMLQKEVAERIASGPGSKKYGILSVLLQAWFKVELLFNVNPGSFFPPPAVKSTVIRLVRNERKELKCNHDLFKRVVKMAFNQRRKVLSNSLKGILLFLDDDPVWRLRPEQLGVDAFIDLTLKIEAQQKIKS
jgi:16S rRNA (adenine1518-N6/adenine1519-N6)-dimethyltransferase